MACRSITAAARRLRRPPAWNPVLTVTAWCLVPHPVLVSAQATPAATSGLEPVTVVARGLVNPRGFTVAEDGSILVALGGRGDLTAQVVRIEANGCPEILVDGFPTARVAFRAITGFADVAVLGEETYALLAGGDIDRGLAVNGLYRLDGASGAELVADLSSFIRDNPVAEIPEDYDTDGQPYDLLPLADASGFWVSEGNSNQLFQVGLDGAISRVADLSAGHPIPTGLAPAPGGDVFVALFSRGPYIEGSAKVIRVTPDGTVTDVWTGLTMPTALAVGPDGSLYATEMATGYGGDPAKIAPGNGRLVRQTGPGTAVPVATGLTFPSWLAIGPDGGFYVASPAFGGEDGRGTIVRIDPGAPVPVDASALADSATACPPTMVGPLPRYGRRS